MPGFNPATAAMLGRPHPGRRRLFGAGLLCLALLGGCQADRAQTTAPPAPPRPASLLERLPLLPLPLRLDSTVRLRPVPVSRREVWQALVLPLQGFRPDSTEWSEEFPIDSASILDYQQWEKLDLNRREATIGYYSPICSGRLFAIGQVALAGGVTGVLWGFEQHDAIYGSGPLYWLVLPGARPGRAEFRTVYQWQQSDAGARRPNTLYLRAELRPEQLTLLRRNAWYPLLHEKPGPPTIEARRQTFTITPRGLVEQRPPAAAEK